MKREIYIIAIVCFLISCQEKKKGDLQLTVKEMVSESQKEIQCFDSVKISQAFHLYYWKITNDKIVFNLNTLNDFILVYSYPEFQFLYSYGKNGQGPNEFIVSNWGNNKELNSITLYDIMKSSLYKYEINNSELTLKQQYSLPKDSDDLCKPFTKILQMNDSIFLMKEDGKNTKLHLTNLKNQQDYDTYQCFLRDQCVLKQREQVPYTAFDYDFDVIEDHILLVYNYIDRLELLRLNKENKIVPLLIVGSNKDQQGSCNPNLKCYFLGIASYSNLFFCLKSNDGSEEGNVLCIFDIDGNFKYQITLDQNVSSIAIDKVGTLVAYKEKNDETMFYRYKLNGILDNIK